MLHSSMHDLWARKYSSHLDTRLKYSIGNAFETYPFPDTGPELYIMGDRLDVNRREVMLARQAGLTKTYNLVHDQHCIDADIAELREIHREVDHATARAYGWHDVDLDHGFYKTSQGVRYTVGPAARQKILDRLLELNHECYAGEVAEGLHKDNKKDDRGGMRLF